VLGLREAADEPPLRLTGLRPSRNSKEEEVILVMEEKEPYWTHWVPQRLLPFTSMSEDARLRAVEVAKLNSVSKSADFRVVEYVRKEV